MPRKQKPKFSKKERRLTGHERIRHAIHRVSLEEDNGMTDERAYRRVQQTIQPAIDIVKQISYWAIDQWSAETIKQRPEEFLAFILREVNRAKEWMNHFEGQRQFKDKAYYAKWKENVKKQMFNRSKVSEREEIVGRIKRWEREWGQLSEEEQKNRDYDYIQDEISAAHAKLDEIDSREFSSAEVSWDDTPTEEPRALRSGGISIRSQSPGQLTSEVCSSEPPESLTSEQIRQVTERMRRDNPMRGTTA